MKEDVFNKYVEEVTRIFRITREQLFSKDKTTAIADARHMLYYLCYHRPMRLVYIQEYMKKNGYTIGHSAIIHGIRKVEEASKEDADYARLIKEVA